MAKRRLGKTGDKNVLFRTTSKLKRGQRSPITDEELWHRRDKALGFFAAEWPEVGWDLRQAQTPGDLHKIFARTEHTDVGESFRRFRIASSAPFDVVTANRKKREQLLPRIQEAYEWMNEIAGLKDRVEGAVANAPESETLELELAYRRLARDWGERRGEYERMSAEEDELRTQITMQEAAFAQSELLRFVREKRYAWNPVNVASAVAGLGYIRYRQSVPRCMRRKPAGSSSLRFEVFRAIENLCLDTTPEQLFAELRERVLKLPRRFASAQRELKRNFYFLRTAVEEAMREHHPTIKFPYAVARKYSRWLSRMSLLDEVRAYDQQLR